MNGRSGKRFDFNRIKKVKDKEPCTHPSIGLTSKLLSGSMFFKFHSCLVDVCMHACTCGKHSLWVGEDHTESNRNDFNCDGSQSSLQMCKTSTGCAPQKASETISTLQFPNLVLSGHVTSLHIQLHKRSQMQSSYTWEQDIAVGNHVAPLSISKISKEITKCIIFGCTKRAGAKHYHPREAYMFLLIFFFIYFLCTVQTFWDSPTSTLTLSLVKYICNPSNRHLFSVVVFFSWWHVDSFWSGSWSWCRPTSVPGALSSIYSAVSQWSVFSC